MRNALGIDFNSSTGAWIAARSRVAISRGKSAKAAVKAAVMVEDVARTVHYALLMGQPDEISAEDVAKLHDRYMNVYGQK